MAIKKAKIETPSSNGAELTNPQPQKASDPKKGPYLRIGVGFFKLQQRPSAHGFTRPMLTSWTSTLIKADHGTRYLNSIPKYEGFCAIPENVNYKRNVNGFYNTYEPISHKPTEGDCSTSLAFIKHIFQDHYELGLDYLQLIYTRPIQRLPILCLVSKERGTGKSTFLLWLEQIFTANMGIYTNQDMDSKFNADWLGKLIIAVDETAIDKKTTTERMKYLTFAPKVYVEDKGIRRQQIDFFAKMILVSNNETDFLQVDEDEVRFWVIKIKPFKGQEIVNMKERLGEEIPHFLHFLLNRKLHTTQRTRMWFTEKQIETEALRVVMRHSKSHLEKEIRSIITEKLKTFLFDLNEQYGEQGREIYFTAKDLMDILKDSNIRSSSHQIGAILSGWELESVNSSYRIYGYKEDIEGRFVLAHKTSKGRYFVFPAQKFLTTQEIEEALQAPGSVEQPF